MTRTHIIGAVRCARSPQGRRHNGQGPVRATVIELEYGITVYEARFDGNRWRAVSYEDGERRRCEVSAGRHAAPPGWRRSPSGSGSRRPEHETARRGPHRALPRSDRLLPGRDQRWSRERADTQRQDCAAIAAPVIDTVTCQDLKTSHLEKIVNAAPTPGKVAGSPHDHRACRAGIEGGYLANARLAKCTGRPATACCPRPGDSRRGIGAVGQACRDPCR